MIAVLILVLAGSASGAMSSAPAPTYVTLSAIWGQQ
jgi:hypothetical protein